MSRFERWSRRKRGLNDTEHEPEIASDTLTPTAVADMPPGEPDSLSNETAGDGVAAVEEPACIDGELPDPDTLDPSGDFKAYLASGVSPELKRRALRRMFTASQYNVRDGLDDYDQDFTQMRDLSHEVASKLRGWMNELPEDTAPDDDRDAATLASHTQDEQADTATRESMEAHNEELPSDGDATSDPSRPKNGTV